MFMNISGMYEMNTGTILIRCVLIILYVFY